MDIDQYEFLNDRIDHVDGRCDDLDKRLTQLEGDEEIKKSRALEWIVIILIVVEIIESVLLWRYSHG
jgi:uncharacterized Rmd1/YagE family protein